MLMHGVISENKYALLVCIMMTTEASPGAAGQTLTAGEFVQRGGVGKDCSHDDSADEGNGLPIKISMSNVFQRD